MARKSLTNTAAARAAGTLTGSGLAIAGETVTIGPIVYTWVAALSAPFQVLIGTALTDCLDNLKSAINGTAGLGSTYATGTTAHPQVTATTKTATALTVQAIHPGAALNAIPTTETMSAAAWAATTLTGGVDNSDQITATGTTTGASVDISDVNSVAAPADFYIDLTVTAMAAGIARFSFPDSVNAFGASLPGPALCFAGPIVPAAPVQKSVHSRDYPGLRAGTASALMRCNLDQLTAASITYTAAIVYG